MSGVDSRIVTMKFDNKQFEQGAAETMSTLDKLKASLHLPGASKGLENVAASTSSLEGGISKINGAFVALGAVAITAISNITTKVMEMGGALASELSMVNAMKDGFADYEMKVGATQTIMAGTGEDIATVTKYLKDLDIYADKTIYSLADMVGNIGKFTNAGVKLPVATNAMIGISNAAALSGANTTDAARAMYNFGDAIGKGAMRLQDWKSIEIANMGTKRFKEELIKGAIASGDLVKGTDGVVKTVKGSVVDFKTFNSTLAEGWLTTEAMTETLGRYADGSKGVGKEALAAAQDIKTFSMMMETLKAAAGTGWTDSFEIVLGTLPEATELFTGITNAIGGYVESSADARNKILGDWKKLDGRKNLIEGLKNVFTALGDVIGTIKKAFRDIFPAMTGERLASLTKGFLEFTQNLKMGDDTAKNLKDTFKGVFAVFSIIGQVISGVVGFIFDLVGALGTGTGGFLAFTGGIGSFLVGIDEALKKGELLKGFFSKLSSAITPVVSAISGLAGAFFALFTGRDAPFLDELSAKFETLAPIIQTIKASIEEFVTFIRTKLSGLGGIFNFGGDASDPTAKMRGSLEGLPNVMDRIRVAWDQVVKAFEAAKTRVQPIIDNLKKAFDTVKKSISEFIKGIGVEDALALINTGFFIMLYRSIKSFTDKLGEIASSASGVLDQLTSNLKTMQADVKADIILKIAAALALLAAAVYVLSTVDTASLAKSLVGVTVLLALMVKSLKALDSGTSTIESTSKLVILSAALIGLGLAVLAFSAAIAVLGNMETATLVKGITAVGAVLGIVVTATNMINKSGGAGAILVASAGILVLSVALTAFAGALKLYSMIDTSTMLEGGLKIAAALLAIAFVMNKMPPNMVASAFALIIVAQALIILSGALKMMGSLSIEEMAKSLVTLGLSLLIISKGLNAMTGSIGGSAALLLFAVALGLLIPPLVALGNIDFGTLAKSLLALVAIFAVLGVSAWAMAPIVPVLFALAGSIALLGLAALAVGAGLLMFATGLATLAASGAAGAAVLIGVVISIAQLFPLIMQQIGLGFVAFAKVIGDKAPIVVAAITKLVKALLKQAKELIPLLPPIISKALLAFLKVVIDSQRKFIAAGIEIVVNLLEGLIRATPRLAKKAGDLIIAFMDAWATEYPRMIDAGFKALIKFINGMVKAIDSNASEMGAAGRRLAGALINGMTGGLAGKAGELASKAWDVAKRAFNAMKSALGIHSPSKETRKLGRYMDEGLIDGLLTYAGQVRSAGEEVGDTALTGLKSSIDKIFEEMTSEIDLAPVITPVLDLSKFQSDASKISSVFGSKTVSPIVSYDQALGISTASQESTAFAGTQLATAEPTVIFEQNNYSPKALSHVEIYRQTRNQLSLAKGVLT